MNLPSPLSHNDAIISQFKPVEDQWELTDTNIKRIDPETGQTILHNYCQYINTLPLDVFQHLIKIHGCDVNAKDKYKDTPLHYALDCFDPTKGGDITVLLYLLSQRNVDVDIENRDGYNLLRLACKNINNLSVDVFKSLIGTDVCDVNANDDNDDNIPLFHAFCYFDPNKGGDIAVLIYLLSQKMYISNFDRDYLFRQACCLIDFYPLELFKLLIERHGADVNEQDGNNETSLQDALHSFNPCTGCDINVLAYLLNQKTVNVNTKYKKGHTLLHYACVKSFPIWHYLKPKGEECDTFLCQIVEVIANKCLELVLDETTS